MKDLPTWILSIAALVGAAAVGYFYGVKSTPPSAAPVAPAPVTVVASSSPSPTAHYPVTDHFGDPSGLESPSASASVPPLDQSDDTIEKQLTSLLGKERLDTLFNVKLQGVIRRIVVTVENGTARLLPQEFSPFKPVPGSFHADKSAEEAGGGLVLSTANFARYTKLVDAFVSVDTARAVAIYSRFYSLFQAAYRDLGILGYFNDRAVAVIDDALAAPEPKGPVKLIQPSVYYKFEDADLEGRSASQKILLRMGPANAGKVKEKLREFREKLVHLDK